MPTNSWTHERAKIASLSRKLPADDPQIIQARQNLKAILLEERIRAVVESAPPLRPEQADKLAALFRAGGAK